MSEDTTPKTEAFWKDAEPTIYGGRQKRLDVPTYDPDGPVEWDWSRPRELTLQEVEGLDIVMGAPERADSPRVIIERAVDRWRVFVNIDGGDTFAIIEITETAATISTDRAGQEPLLTQERIVGP